MLGELPWCMLFVDGIVLINETHDRPNDKLEIWRWDLEFIGLVYEI